MINKEYNEIGIFVGGVIEIPVRRADKLSVSYFRLTTHSQKGEVSGMLQTKTR